MTRDRAGAAEFVLTQEFWSLMLGTRRASISTTAAALRSKGIITYARGHVEILDEPALLEESCECYLLIRE